MIKIQRQESRSKVSILKIQALALVFVSNFVRHSSLVIRHFS